MSHSPSTRLSRPLMLPLLLLSLSGCASLSPPVVELASLDASCPALTQAKPSLTWDVRDTAPTINGVRRMRAMIAKLCPPAGKKVA